MCVTLHFILKRAHYFRRAKNISGKKKVGHLMMGVTSDYFDKNKYYKGDNKKVMILSTLQSSAPHVVGLIDVVE